MWEPGSLSMTLVPHEHEWEEIDRIGCMYHVGLGCEDVMEECKCGKTRERHSMKNAIMSMGEWKK